jgi:hypothetical protein
MISTLTIKLSLQVKTSTMSALERALTASRPRARYIAPFGARIMVALAAWLPMPILDWLLMSMFGMTRKRLKISTPA